MRLSIFTDQQRYNALRFLAKGAHRFFFLLRVKLNYVFHSQFPLVAWGITLRSSSFRPSASTGRRKSAQPLNSNVRHYKCASLLSQSEIFIDISYSLSLSVHFLIRNIMSQNISTSLRVSSTSAIGLNPSFSWCSFIFPFSSPKTYNPTMNQMLSSCCRTVR